MLTFLLTLETIIAIALIAIILMQKSEGGVLGIGGGAKFGGSMSGENAKNFLTTLTKYLSIAFFGICLILSLMIYSSSQESPLSNPGNQPVQTDAENPNDKGL